MYSDHFLPHSPLRTIHIHNQQLLKEVFPVSLCHPAYINSVQGMQQLSGKLGKREAAVRGKRQRDSRKIVLCDGLRLTANGTV